MRAKTNPSGPKTCEQCGVEFRVSPNRHTTARFCSIPCSAAFHKIARPLAVRFWEKVAKGPDSDCWFWQGAKFISGYGCVWLNGQQVYTHRVAYELAKGPIPEDLMIRHTCDVRACCNPHHLLVGTAAENNQDKIDRGRHPRGEQDSKAKLTEADVREIRELLRAGVLPQHEIGKRFNVSRGAILNIKNGSNWKHVA